MPRQTETRKNSRTQLSQTGGLPGIRPAASPTDPYAQVPQGSSLQRTLSNAMVFLEEKGKLDAHVAKEDAHAGMLARYQETDVNLDEHTRAFINGYNKVEGELALDGYIAEIKRTEEEFGHLPWEDPTDDEGNSLVDPETGEVVLGMGNRLLAIEQRYMDELPQHKEALKSFAPEALKAKSTIEEAFKLKKLEEAHAELTVKQEARANIVIRNTLKEGKSLRGALSEMQEFASVLGFSRDEITALFVKQAGMRAVKLGDDSIMDFIDEADGSGTRVLDTKHAAKAIQYRNQAAAVGAANEKAAIAAEEEAVKEYEQGITNSFADAALSLNSLSVYEDKDTGRFLTSRDLAIQKAEELRTGVDANGKPFKDMMSRVDYTYAMKLFQDHIQGKGVADRTDPEVFRVLRYNALLIRNKEDEQRWKEQYSNNTGRLSDSDRKILTGLLDSKLKEEKSELKTQIQHVINTEEDFIYKEVYQDEAVKALGILSPDLSDIYQDMMKDYQDAIIEASASTDQPLDLAVVRALGEQARGGRNGKRLETIMTRIRDKMNASTEGGVIIETDDPAGIR